MKKRAVSGETTIVGNQLDDRQTVVIPVPSETPPKFKTVLADIDNLTRKILAAHKIDLKLPVKANIQKLPEGDVLDVDGRELWWSSPEAYAYVYYQCPPYATAFGLNLFCKSNGDDKYWLLSIPRQHGWLEFLKLIFHVTTASLAKRPGETLFLSPQKVPAKIIKRIARYATCLKHPPRPLIDEKAFWRLIDSARKKTEGNLKKMVALLKKDLKKKPARARAEFDDLLTEKIKQLDRKETWAVAGELIGPISDDGFEEFRAWVVAQGPDVFIKTLQTPSSLLEMRKKGAYKYGDYELEEFLYVAQ